MDCIHFRIYNCLQQELVIETAKEVAGQCLFYGALSGVCLFVSENVATLVFGIGLGRVASTISMRILETYSNKTASLLKRLVHQKNYCTIAMIAFVVLLAISCISLNASFQLAILLGCYCSINFDVGNDKKKLSKLHSIKV